MKNVIWNQPNSGFGSVALKDVRSATRYALCVEKHALKLRLCAGSRGEEPLDTARLRIVYKVDVAYPKDIDSLGEEVSAYLSELSPQTWSGMSLDLPNGRRLVVLNPNMTIERERVTLMEEISHMYHGHAPSELHSRAVDFGPRKHDAQVEKEAYWTAAAALLPSVAVGKAVWNAVSVEELAANYEVSVELAEFRIKTLGLWAHHRRNCEF